MKCVSDPSHVIESDDFQVRENLTVETILLKIVGREVKKLRNKENIASVKVWFEEDRLVRMRRGIWRVR
jgi:hypothetical protein